MLRNNPEYNRSREQLLPEATKAVKGLCQRTILAQGGIQDSDGRPSTVEQWEAVRQSYPFSNEISSLRSALQVSGIVDRRLRIPGQILSGSDYDSLFARFETCFGEVYDPLARRILTSILVTRCSLPTIEEDTVAPRFKRQDRERPQTYLTESYNVVADIDTLMDVSGEMKAQLGLKDDDSMMDKFQKTSTDAVISAVLEGRIAIDFAPEPSEEQEE